MYSQFAVIFPYSTVVSEVKQALLHNLQDSLKKSHQIFQVAPSIPDWGGGYKPSDLHFTTDAKSFLSEISAGDFCITTYEPVTIYKCLWESIKIFTSFIPQDVIHNQLHKDSLFWTFFCLADYSAFVTVRPLWWTNIVCHTFLYKPSSVVQIALFRNYK